MEKYKNDNLQFLLHDGFEPGINASRVEQVTTSCCHHWNQGGCRSLVIIVILFILEQILLTNHTSRWICLKKKELKNAIY